MPQENQSDLASTPRQDEAEALRQRALDLAQQKNRRLCRICLVLAGLAAVAMLGWIFAAWQSTQAQARQLAASAELAFTEGNTNRAVLLALEAQNLDQTAGAELLYQTIPAQARLAPGHLLREPNSQIMSLAWHPAGTRLATAAFDGTIIIWETASWQQETILTGHNGAVLSVAWHPDGTYLASASLDRTIIIWTTDTWQRETVLNVHKDAVWSTAWSPDGSRLATAAADRTIIIWNAATWQQEGVLTGHTDAIWSVAWHPNGIYLASGSSDESIIIWNTNRREEQSIIHGHTGTVRSVAWHPDGTHLASGSADRSLRVTPQVFTRHPCHWLMGANLSLWQWKAQRHLALYQPTCANLAFVPIPFGINANYLVYTLSGRLLAGGAILSGLALLSGLVAFFVRRAKRRRRFKR